MKINWARIAQEVIADAIPASTRTGTEVHYATRGSGRTWCGCRAIVNTRYPPAGPITCDKCLEAYASEKKTAEGR